MAKMNFTDVENLPQQSSGTGHNSVGFFSLKNDGDTAIVRIMHDTTEDFDIESLHDVKVDGKYKKISCLRNSVYDDVENCPLCAGGYDVKHKFFIHLIEYVQDATTGKLVALPKIWERPLSYAKELKTLLINYGPLSNSLFKVQRNGAAGDMKTTYNIMYCPPAMYPDNVYQKLDNPFKDYSVLGTIVWDKTKEELTQFLVSGAFPTKFTTNNTLNNSVSANTSESLVAPNGWGTDSMQLNTPPTTVASQTSFAGANSPMTEAVPLNNTVNNVGANLPNANAQMYASEITRPTRYYN